MSHRVHAARIRAGAVAIAITAACLIVPAAAAAGESVDTFAGEVVICTPTLQGPYWFYDCADPIPAEGFIPAMCASWIPAVWYPGYPGAGYPQVQRWFCLVVGPPGSPTYP
ncbi:MAG: hypothetical protein JHC95_21230, partial [Solirubrobacteraceae bacterium]|nr:hypothetical protein [Solirubrobacteraceae bacterium]